ncbi:MAG TPA: hypothetical protein VGJ57_11095 [Nitrospirales bacterium]|jgi:hypothetical protein
MLIPVRLWVRRVTALALIVFAAHFIAQAASAYDDSLEKAQTYAVVDWPDPMNPKFVNLGGDQYVLATTKGMQIWHARKNVFSESRGWPIHSSLQTHWARLAKGTLLVAESHSDEDVLQHTLVWWNPEKQDFSATLPLQEAAFVSELVPINQQHALVCMRTDYGKPGVNFDMLPTKAAVVSHSGGKLHWETDASKNMRTILLEAHVRGVAEGVGTLDEPESTVKMSPVIFNTASCKWEMRRPPQEIAEGRNVTIKHHRLPDGRILIAQADWYSPARNSGAELAGPLLWDEAAGAWIAIENTAQAGNSGHFFTSYGIDDPVVSVPVVGAEFVEFLDPRTLHWHRSQQKLPDTYAPALGPLSTGEAIVFLREGGRTIVVNPMGEPVPGRFAYSHSYFGEVKLAKGGLLLTGGGDQWHPANRPEILTLIPSPRSKTIAPLPKPLGYLSGVEMQDGTLLVFGGLPPRCAPSNYSSDCAKSPAQPSYRYFPTQDRWEEVPELRVPFANGQFWDAGNSDIASQWPRNDAIVRRNGDFIYLNAENSRRREDTDWTPVVTTPVRWRPEGKPMPLALLRKGRTYATLVELADDRLAVIGGQAQQELVALEKECFNCPDEFVSVGSMQWARSTEVFDDKAGTWMPGPTANYPGGRAFQLSNGRIFKLSLTGLWSAENGYSAEIADAAFTRWDKLPPFPIQSFTVMHVTVIGNRVLILPQEPDRKKAGWIDKTVVWNDDTRSWSVWNQWTKQVPLTVTPVDSKRVLARYYRSYEIVSLPK